jgi:hypothetical protein
MLQPQPARIAILFPSVTALKESSWVDHPMKNWTGRTTTIQEGYSYVLGIYDTATICLYLDSRSGLVDGYDIDFEMVRYYTEFDEEAEEEIETDEEISIDVYEIPCVSYVQNSGFYTNWKDCVHGEECLAFIRERVDNS